MLETDIEVLENLAAEKLGTLEVEVTTSASGKVCLIVTENPFQDSDYYYLGNEGADCYEVRHNGEKPSTQPPSQRWHIHHLPRGRPYHAGRGRARRNCRLHESGQFQRRRNCGLVRCYCTMCAWRKTPIWRLGRVYLQRQALSH